jgi:hypothetical protein
VNGERVEWSGASVIIVKEIEESQLFPNVWDTHGFGHCLWRGVAIVSLCGFLVWKRADWVRHPPTSQEASCAATVVGSSIGFGQDETVTLENRSGDVDRLAGSLGGIVGPWNAVTGRVKEAPNPGAATHEAGKKGGSETV